VQYNEQQTGITGKQTSAAMCDLETVTFTHTNTDVSSLIIKNAHVRTSGNE